MLHLSPPPGGSAIFTARILYVDTTGDNATAVIGNPSKPFETAQGAFDAASAESGDCHIKCGVGNFGTVVLPDGGWPSRITISGVGYAVSRLTGINGTGTGGSNGANHATAPTAGANGGAGRSMSIRSDGTINLGAITANGGAGGTPGQYSNAASEATNGSDGLAGANGGDAGNITLVNVVYDTITNTGGAGGAGGDGQFGGPGTTEVPAGNGGNGGAGGNGGRRGAVVLHYCRCTVAGGGDIMSENGVGGAGGTEGLGGTDNGAGAGSSGSAGSAGAVPSGFSKDFILVNSGIGAVQINTTDGEEIMANVLHESLFVDGSSTPSLGGDLGGNIATEVHKLP